jgi:hypothetical protein
MKTYVHSEYNLSTDIESGAAFDVIVRKTSFEEFVEFESADCSMLIGDLEEDRFVLTETLAFDGG